MPKIKIREGKQDLINIIQELQADGKEELAKELTKLVTRNGYESGITCRKGFGVLYFDNESQN